MSIRLNAGAGALVALAAVAATVGVAAWLGSPRAPRPEAARPAAPAAPRETPPEMIWIPPGAVVIGDTEEDLHDLFRRIGKKNAGNDYWASLARPHERIKAVPRGFFLDRTEVTNRAFDEFLKATGGRPPEGLGVDAERRFTDWHDGRVIPGREDHPVYGVTAFEAEAYALWAGKRLPTEIEWEYAARGDDGRAYPWGDEWLPDRANGALSGEDDTVRVGSYPLGASPFGVLDMAGNVWEWTASEFALYPGNMRLTGSEGGRAIRGGGHPQVPAALRCSVRVGLAPPFRTQALGFRCARDAD